MRDTTKVQDRAGQLEKALKVAREADGAKARLLELLGRVTSQHTVDDICRTLVEGVRELLRFERAGLFLWDASIKTFRGTYGTDLNLRTVDEHTHITTIEPDSPEEHIMNGSPIERGCKLGAPPARPGEEDIKADLIALRVEGTLYGILSVDNRLSRRPILDWELEHLQLLGQILGNALERARAQAALAESEQRFQQVAEHSGEWIWELDPAGRYTYSSPVVSRILGYRPEEILGRSIADRAIEDDKALIEAALKKCVLEKRPLERIESRQIGRGGAPVVLETNAIPVLEAGGRLMGFRGVHRDVTHEKNLEAQLRHSQKIEAIGRLAGGIAHDFNNVLTAIIGGAGLLLEDMKSGDPLRPEIEKIQLAGERAATLTRQLLAFSRRQVMRVEKIKVNAIVRDMEKLLRRTIGEDIELVTKLDPVLDEIESDADQIQQIILHISINARDAMGDPEGMVQKSLMKEILSVRAKMGARPKRLTIETVNVLLDQAFCSKQVGAAPGRHILVSIRDTGIGMSAETVEHLFEPFFTTKEVGRGSGLGLSTIYGIVKQMGGLIKVESSLGEGSVFQIYLPVAGARSEQGAGSPQEVRNVHGNETILVVEDEEVVRRLTIRMLQTLGYKTVEAAHGVEALEVLRTYTEPIHLILTDMIMPHMSGKQFVEELRKAGRQSKVLFVSGYSSDDTVGGKLIGVETPLIQKPFTRDMLGRKVREVLDAPTGPG